VLRGGTVLTLDRRSSVANAVAVDADRITAVGGDAEISARIDAMAAQLVLP